MGGTVKYGFCTGFATEPLFNFDEGLVKSIENCGYDYAELPLFTIESLPDDIFETFSEAFSAPVSCNLVPGRLNLYTTAENVLESYFLRAFARARRIGNRFVIFGSGSARTYPESIGKDEAFSCLVSLIRRIMIPSASTNGITVLVEPLKRGECNIINTLAEGAELVDAVDSPSFSLMADIYHMEANGESLDKLEEFFPLIHHVHISEQGRKLPGRGFSHYVSKALSILCNLGYSYDISYETEDGDKEAALALLKSYTVPAACLP